LLPDRAAADAWQLLRVALSAAEEQLRGEQLEDWIRCYLDVNYGQGPEWTDDNTITAVVQRLNGLARTWRDATDTRIARARNHSIRTTSHRTPPWTTWPTTYVGDVGSDLDSARHWLEVVQRVIAIGRAVVHTKRFDLLPQLVHRQVPIFPRYTHETWIRHAHVAAARNRLLTGCVMAATVASGRAGRAFYPSCASFHQWRSQPAIDTIATDQPARSATFPDTDDQAVAQALADVVDAAVQVSFQYGGFWGGCPPESPAGTFSPRMA